MVLPFYSARLESWRLLSLSTRLMVGSSRQQPEWLSINVSLHTRFFLSFSPKVSRKSAFPHCYYGHSSFLYIFLSGRRRDVYRYKREKTTFILLSFHFDLMSAVPPRSTLFWRPPVLFTYYLFAPRSVQKTSERICIIIKKSILVVRPIPQKI